MLAGGRLPMGAFMNLRGSQIGDVHPRWPSSSILPPHLRPTLGPARLRACWEGHDLVWALGVREPMPAGPVRRHGGEELFLAAFHQPTPVRLASGMAMAPANALIAWEPGTMQEYGCTDRVWLHSWLHLRNPAGGLLARLAGLPMAAPVPLEDPGAWEGALIELHAELSRTPSDALVVHALCSILLRRIARSAQPAGDGIDEVDRLIRADPCATLRLTDLAAIAGCTPQHLCRSFQQRHGRSPIALACDLRLAKAAQLLRGGASPGQAAAACGWADRRQFTRLFRQRFGSAPTAWQAADPSSG